MQIYFISKYRSGHIFSRAPLLHDCLSFFIFLSSLSFFFIPFIFFSFLLFISSYMFKLYKQFDKADFFFSFFSLFSILFSSFADPHIRLSNCQGGNAEEGGEEREKDSMQIITTKRKERKISAPSCKFLRQWQWDKQRARSSTNAERRRKDESSFFRATVVALGAIHWDANKKNEQASP